MMADSVGYSILQREVALRDQFAMAALTGAVELAKVAAAGGDVWGSSQIAECAYQFADAMLAERERVK